MGIIKLSTPNFLRTVENCIREGSELQRAAAVVNSVGSGDDPHRLGCNVHKWCYTHRGNWLCYRVDGAFMLRCGALRGSLACKHSHIKGDPVLGVLVCLHIIIYEHDFSVPVIQSLTRPTRLPDPNVFLAPEPMSSNLIRTATGNAVLLENVEEVLDPSLEPVLLKQARHKATLGEGCPLCPTTRGITRLMWFRFPSIIFLHYVNQFQL